jgi:hypothetical protein
MGRIKLHPPPDMLPLIEHAISFVDEVAKEDRQIKAEVCSCRCVPLWTQIDPALAVFFQAICKRLVERREMLEEYFSMSVSEDGKVETLPLLLKGYTPNMDRLPEFLMRLGPGVGVFSSSYIFHILMSSCQLFA